MYPRFRKCLLAYVFVPLDFKPLEAHKHRAQWGQIRALGLIALSTYPVETRAFLGKFEGAKKPLSPAKVQGAYLAMATNQGQEGERPLGVRHSDPRGQGPWLRARTRKACIRYPWAGAWVNVLEWAGVFARACRERRSRRACSSAINSAVRFSIRSRRSGERPTIISSRVFVMVQCPKSSA